MIVLSGLYRGALDGAKRSLAIQRLRNDRIDAVAHLRAYTDALAEVFTFAGSCKVYIPDQAPVIRHKAAHTVRQRLGSFTNHDAAIA